MRNWLPVNEGSAQGALVILTCWDTWISSVELRSLGCDWKEAISQLFASKSGESAMKIFLWVTPSSET